MPRPQSTSPTTARRRGLRASGYLAAVALVVYHGWLFAGRLRDATIREPEVLLRWLLAIALIGLALDFRRRGLSILHGRSAIAFWALALLLHLGPLPMPVTNEAPPSLLVLPLALAAPFLIAVLAARVAPRVRPSWWSRGRRDAVHRQRSVLTSYALRFAPRPPPAS
jgi:hypothetical protein